MKKQFYLILIGILGFGYIPPQILNEEVTTVLLYLLWFSSFIFFKPSSENILYRFKNTKWVYIILFLFLFSSITPYLNYGQSIISSIIALRKDILIIYLITFLRLQPNEEILFKSLRFLSFLSILSFFLVILFPRFYVPVEKLSLLIQFEGTKFSVIYPPGFDLAIFYLFFLVQRILGQPMRKDIVQSLIFISFILLVQNRSTIIGVVPLIGYAFYKARFRFKYLYIFIFITISILYVTHIAVNLWEASITQIDSFDYNRWQALSFFLVEWKQSFYTYIFGNGAPSYGSRYLNIIQYATETRYAFVSDIGLLGTYFQYGIAMLLLIYRFVFKALFSKYTPVFLKFYAFWILIVPTIHSFGLGATSYAIKWSIFFYLVIYYVQVNRNTEQCKFQLS